MHEGFMRQKDILIKLEAEGIVTPTKQAFSKAVKVGNIPHLKVDGLKHKLFHYEAVVDIIERTPMFGYDPEAKKEPPEDKPKEDKNDISREELRERLKTNPKLSDANTLKIINQVEDQELKLAIAKGESISRALVEDTVFKGCRVVRDKLLTIPERVSNELASMTNAHEIKELLYKEQISALESFTPELLVPKETK